jgi:DNA modification methylase
MKHDVETLQDLEAVIECSLQSYVEIGTALRAIRDGRLYRKDDPGTTFAQYCLKRWNFARQTAYDYLKGSQVAANVRTSVQFEASLSQAVELASLEPTKQRAVAEAIQAAGRSFQEVAVFDLRNIVQCVKSGSSPAEAVDFAIGTCAGIRNDENAVPDPPEDPVSQAGDLYLLGDHRLLMGDATNHSDVMRLLAGECADLVFTDPPYNVDYEGYTEDRLTIIGDSMSETDFKEFLAKAFRACASAMKPSASMYVCHASCWQREFQNAIEAAGFKVRSQVMWVKNTFGWGFARYKFQHEPMFYCHFAGHTDEWYGDRRQTTVWQEDKPFANRLHPTMKPVELIERALINSSKVGDIVLDLFGGSGSTLIGCERLRRKARLMEIDPKYADVIVQRWQDQTGKKAILERDGRAFDQIAEIRMSKAA